MAEPQKKPRIEIIDALRGFSLAGIVIVHMVENYIAAPVPEGAMDAAHQGTADYVIDGFILLFLRGKFFALFSFLFGLSFFIQMKNADLKGQNYQFRFLWRLTLLLIIGYLHSLFYRGDILTIYALLGIFLVPFYRLKKQWIVVSSIVLFLGLGRYLVFLFTQGDSLFTAGNYGPDSPEIIQYFNVLSEGSIWEVFKTNAWEGHIMKMDFQLGIFSRGYLTFGFFLLGLYTGKIDFFRNYLEKRQLVKDLLWGSVILLCIAVVITAGSFMQLGPEPEFNNWIAMLGLTGFDLVNVALTFIILCLFVMIYRSEKWKRRLDSFTPYGRTALTNYVLQSIVGTFVFYGWGLGYIGKLSNTVSFALAILLIIAQILISKWWMKRFYYGPFEWLWRSLTFITIYPFRRSKSN
ncbi:DUF418 domain-containing protein [Muriicola sp. E247]|uniref:DUF418 domain-containing protein n=1 Tax=Muriicola sp. E247 TaxID=3242730 RepID=UPI003524F0C7